VKVVVDISFEKDLISVVLQIVESILKEANPAGGNREKRDNKYLNSALQMLSCSSKVNIYLWVNFDLRQHS